MERTHGLVLSRRLNESIFIGENVTIKVIELQSNQVRLLIEAPRDVIITRPEVKDRKHDAIAPRS